MIPQAQQNKKSQGVLSNDNVIESLRNLGGGVGKTVTKDVVGKIATDALTSIFTNTPKEGELRPNQAVDLRSEQDQAPRAAAVRQEFVRTAPLREDETALRQQVEAVRQELKMLASSVKQLNAEISQAINDIPVNPGIYHLNFMDRLRSILKTLREKIEDSGTWLALTTSRKQKKGYWGKYKKHGTTFGLSSERSVSTQAG